MKFRGLPNTLCFYEPFHGVLASGSRVDLAEHGPEPGDLSHHPETEPYFQEFVPLLRKSGGVRLYDQAMAREWFVPRGGLHGELREAEQRYLGLLLRHAGRRGKVPVLGCVRTLGRLFPIKRQFGGSHIFLRRNLWTQWMSYLWLKRSGVPFFYDRVLDLDSGEDGFLGHLRDYYLARAGGTAAAAEHGGRPLASLSEPQVFAMFMAINLYLYTHAELTADITVDATRLAMETGYREETEQLLAELTGLPVTLADASHTQQFVPMHVAAIDWDEIGEHRRAAVAALNDIAWHQRTEEIADGLLKAAREEFLLSERYQRSARVFTVRMRHQLIEERDAAIAERDRLIRERDAAIEERDRLRREKGDLPAPDAS